MLAIAAGLLLACMVAWPMEAAAAAMRGLTLWATAVLPSLFPFMVCCQLLAASDTLARLGAPLDGLARRLLRCPGEAAPLVLLGLLGGSPSGARMIAARRAEGALTCAEAERLACLTGTVSPMFLLGALAGWAGLPQGGWLLLGAHWAGALVVGLVFARLIQERDFAPGGERPEGFAVALRPPSRPIRASKQAAAFGEAVHSAAQALLTVGGCIALGTVASAMVGRLLPSMPAALSAALHAALEMAGGAAELAALRLPPRALLCALAAAPSLGGLSILAQNMAFLSPANVRAWPLLSARLLHAALSAAIAWLLTPRLATVAFVPARGIAFASPAIYGAALCVVPAMFGVLGSILHLHRVTAPCAKSPGFSPAGARRRSARACPPPPPGPRP
ncbi:MAG: hypothetical protein FWE77_01530 [Clostridia bacterium]|nr:hypothetical protein [Clostridia bacterium]